jgi:AAA domain
MTTIHKVTTIDSVPATSLRGTNFALATRPVKRRLILSASAEQGSGKTNFGLSAPGPVAYINLDLNDDGVIQKYQHAKRIYRSQYTLPNGNGSNCDKISEAAQEAWESVLNDYMGALRDPSISSIVIDTATELWELLRLAVYGKLTAVVSRDYQHANAVYRQLIREVEGTEKNLILLHKMAQEYKADKPTGNMVRAGFKHTGYLVQAEVELWKVPQEDYPDKFHCRITKCTLNPETEGVELAGDGVNFHTLAQLVFPDWE